MRKIAQGAEALISKDGKLVIKERVRKGYRIQELDKKLRQKRTRLEARLLREARRAGVLTPQVSEESEFVIKMDYVGNTKIRDKMSKYNYKEICTEIGRRVAKLHDTGIIHGDLTTSNMIFVRKPKNDFEIYFIDFGLGFQSTKAEDKATDLHVFKEALHSTHFDVAEEAWSAFLDSYMQNYHRGWIVIKALSKIERRGRYQKDR